MAFAFGYCVGPKTLGVDFSAVHSTAQHPLGTIAYDNKGRKMLYVKANGSIGLGNFVKASSAATPFTDVVIGTASNAATWILGMAPQALSAGNYAWIVASGLFEDSAQIVSASVAAGDPLICDANGDATIAVETDINNARAVCLVDGGSNTGSIILF